MPWEVLVTQAMLEYFRDIFTVIFLAIKILRTYFNEDMLGVINFLCFWFIFFLVCEDVATGTTNYFFI